MSVGESGVEMYYQGWDMSRSIGTLVPLELTYGKQDKKMMAEQ